MRRTVRVAAFLAVAVIAACSGGSKKAATTTTTSSSKSSSSSSSTSSSSAAATPAGFVAIADPKGTDPSLFGQNVAVSTTKDGRPVVAFAVRDVDGPTSTIETTTLDATTHTFGPPVTVATATPATSDQSTSLAHDASTDALILAWDDNGQIKAALSADEGATWKQAAVTTDAHGARTPSVAAAGGQVVVAFADDDNSISLAGSSEQAPPSFTVRPAPTPADGSALRTQRPSVSVASDGTFGAAYVVSPPAGGAAVAYAKQDSPAVVAFDSRGVQNDSPVVALAFSGTTPIVTATLCRAESEDDACTFAASSSDGGATFAPPVVVPGDSGTGGGLAMSAAADANGDVAIAYNPNSGNGSEKCGIPKLVESRDKGATWTVCGPDSPDPDGSAKFGAGAPALAVSPSQALIIAFQQTSTSATAPTGILVKIIG